LIEFEHFDEVTMVLEQTHEIDNPKDRRFPFGREFFDDRLILYHGTCSAWAPTIERDGFAHGRLAFDWRSVATVFDANRLIGRGSMLPMFLGEYPKKRPPFNLYLTSNFWLARAYATNKGSEVIKQAIREAEQFERICMSPEARAELRRHLEGGLRQGDHAPTRAALQTLGDDKGMDEWYVRVKAAREELSRTVSSGYPVVYAIRVESTWFAEGWKRYLYDYENALAHTDLRCPAIDVTPNRILGKVTYPSGTESDYELGCFTWEDALARRQS
jgi:hypothetical protein